MNDVTAPPRWSLHDLPFAGPQKLEAALARLEDLVARLEQSRPDLRDNLPPVEFLALLQNLERIYTLSAELSGYAYLYYAENTQSPDALSVQGRIDQALTDASNRALFFGLWFKNLPDEAAAPYIEAAGERRYYLESLRRFKPYTLTEPEEKIVNLKDLNGSQALIKVYELITNGFSFQVEVDGQAQTLTRDGLSRLYHHPSPDVRAGAYTELYRVYGGSRLPLAEVYAALVRDLRAEAIEMRGYASPIAVRNLGNDLPDAVVETLLNVCRRNVGLFQRYFRLKARLLGIDRLRRYDIYAPVAAAEKTIPFEAAVGLVFESFRQFSPVMAGAAAKVIEQNHLDAEVRPGKRAGAFNFGVTPTLMPWVLVNYTGRLRDVSTLAHELGHSAHSVLAAHHSILTFHAPLPLAETASVFAEMLVTDRLLSQEPDPAVQRDLLMTILDDAYATVLRQAFLSIFEQDAHAMIAAGCTSDDLAARYRENLAEQFGDAVEVSDEFGWEWLTVPHIFNSPFYPYAYSFGQLLVLALYQQYLSEREAFVPRYLRLLAYGGSAAPQAILAEAGIDIASDEFWQGGFAVLEAKLDRLEQIVGGSL